MRSYRCPLMLWSYEGGKYLPSFWLRLSRSRGREARLQHFCMALHTGRRQGQAGMLAGGTECVLARLFGPGTWWAKPPGHSHGWEGQRKRICVLLKGTFMCENGLLCMWKCVPSLASGRQKLPRTCAESPFYASSPSNHEKGNCFPQWSELEQVPQLPVPLFLQL